MNTPPPVRLFAGSVWHARLLPVAHAFRYRHAWIAVALPAGDAAALGLAPGVVWQRRRHGPRDGSPLWPWLLDKLALYGITRAARAELHALPAVFGYVFNPVSFYLVYDSADALIAVWVEVSNTFGDHHDYCVWHPNGSPIGPRDTFLIAKRLHVSPFFQVEGHYRFRFAGGLDGSFAVQIDYSRASGSEDFSARLVGHPRALTKLGLMHLMFSTGSLTLAVWGRIHWQALRLAMKRVPFFGKRGRAADAPYSRRTG